MQDLTSTLAKDGRCQSWREMGCFRIHASVVTSVGTQRKSMQVELGFLDKPLHEMSDLEQLCRQWLADLHVQTANSTHAPTSKLLWSTPDQIYWFDSRSMHL